MHLVYSVILKMYFGFYSRLSMMAYFYEKVMK